MLDEHELKAWYGLGCNDDAYEADDIYPAIVSRASFRVEDKFEPLFTSATWTLTAYVDNVPFFATSPANAPRGAEFIERWTKLLIRTKKSELAYRGVDVNAEYTKFGGNLDDLS